MRDLVGSYWMPIDFSGDLEIRRHISSLVPKLGESLEAESHRVLHLMHSCSLKVKKQALSQ
jgi:hypothetical protein